ncbi:MAG: helix-turn-helix domain-containing protein [Nitrospira sp.]|nr:helix-turn-helix domain-containing protein [Nitrospira sp.]
MNDVASKTTVLDRDPALSGDSEILTIMDVARFLRVPKSTVYKLARVGELPGAFSAAISMNGCAAGLRWVVKHNQILRAVVQAGRRYHTLCCVVRGACVASRDQRLRASACRS